MRPLVLPYNAMKLVFLDLKTGKLHRPDADFSLFWWSEGNGDDCNRILFCCPEEEEEDEDIGACIGSTRFVAVDIQDQVLGNTVFTAEDETADFDLALLDQVNTHYPPIAECIVRAYHGVL